MIQDLKEKIHLSNFKHLEYQIISVMKDIRLKRVNKSLDLLLQIYLNQVQVKFH
jgi:hypothetical protein